MEQLELFPGSYSPDDREAHRFIPPEVIVAAIELMGAIDLDPCSNSKTTPDVPAKLHFTAEDDGLAQSWGPKKRRIFLTPPTRTTGRWIAKLCSEYETGNVSEAIIFVRAVVDSEWWQSLAEYPVCFLNRRIRLASHNRNTTPLAVVYIGRNFDGFVDAFSEIGRVYVQIDHLEHLDHKAEHVHMAASPVKHEKAAVHDPERPLETVRQGQYALTVNHNACYLTITHPHWDIHSGGADQLRLQKAILEIPGIVPSRYSALSKSKDGSVRLIFSFKKGEEERVISSVEALLTE